MCDVLVLDDDPLVRSVAVEVLAEAGFSVVEASCLKEARRALEANERCKVLLVDHDLGEHDRANGFDFARERLAVFENATAIYVTGRWHLYDGWVPTPRERHLPKPFRLADLVRSVEELVGDVHRPASVQDLTAKQMTAPCPHPQHPSVPQAKRARQYHSAVTRCVVEREERS